MNQTIEKNMIQLKILGKIPNSGKLSTSHGISLENKSIFQGLFRTFRHESRQESIKAIKEIIFDTVDITNNMINSRFVNIFLIKEKDEVTQFEKEEYNRVFLLLKQYSQELKNSMIGLKHLQETYSNDVDIISKLEVIFDHIRYQIVQIEQKLSEVS